jgi:hypothetical protein
MIIETTSGRFLNTAHMREFRFTRSKDDKFECGFAGEWSDGSTFNERVYQSVYEQFAWGHKDHLPQLVPSPPGYWMLGYNGGSDYPEEVMRDPVIAWELDRSGFHQVYTAHDAPDDGCVHDRSGILCPNGVVVDPGSGYWDDEAAWLKAMREKHLPKAAE